VSAAAGYKGTHTRKQSGELVIGLTALTVFMVDLKNVGQVLNRAPDFKLPCWPADGIDEDGIPNQDEASGTLTALVTAGADRAGDVTRANRRRTLGEVLTSNS
jgi:hypothetical protein